MRITTIDPILDNRWDDFIMRHPESTIFHHSAWAKVIRDRYNRSPIYYILENEQGELRGVAPFFRIPSPLIGQRLVCLPCSERCFPLAYSQEDMAQLIDSVKDEVHSGRVSYMEVRGWGNSAAPEELDMKEQAWHLTHVTRLDGDPERLKAGLDYGARRNLKRAENSELSVREAQGEDDVREFHRLFSLMRRRRKLLPWPRRFFQSIYRHIIVPGHGFMLFVELEGKPIAGSIFLRFGGTVNYELNGSDDEYFEYRANFLLMWKAMERACQEGYLRFDLGHTHPENQGLARFKRCWGAEEIVLPYYYYPAVSGIGSREQAGIIYRAYNALNRYTPGFVLKLVGEALFKYGG